ncbi:MAG TPA: hypothetical protein PKC49_12790, partial [Phycisphaerae bacterium]|nr:hypothetical protein [Phycisphaerae bacterium]
MGWSQYAFERGPWRIYDLPAGQPLIVRIRTPQGETVERAVSNRHACNYPPLSAYVFWAQGAVWSAIEPRVLPVPAQFEGGAVSSRWTRVIDTPASRLANAAPSIVLDFVLAWGVAALVGALRPAPSAVRRALAFAVTLLAPPVIMDSSFWNQADSWLAAGLVWSVALLVQGRWTLAGAAYGAALMTKPQAVLLLPVLVYVALALRCAPHGTWSSAAAMLRFAAVAVLVVLLVAAPFMVNDAYAEDNPHGAWRWLQRSYIGTISSPLYERTTLSAFNLWWIDLLAQGRPGPGGWEPLWDPRVIVAGLSKAAWGKLLLAAALLGAASLCAWRWRWSRTTWVALAAVTLLAAFALPTRVHERYVYFCIPFLLAMAMLRRWWVVPAALMLVVGTFEMTSFRWAGLARLYEPDGVAWAGSLLLAVCTVVSLGLSLALLAAEKASRHEETLTTDRRAVQAGGPVGGNDTPQPGSGK